MFLTPLQIRTFIRRLGSEATSFAATQTRFSPPRRSFIATFWTLGLGFTALFLSSAQLAPAGVVSLDFNDPQVQNVLSAQSEVTADWMQQSEVLGTAVSADDNGTPVLTVYIDRNAAAAQAVMRNLPANVHGVNVQIRLTDKFRASQGAAVGVSGHRSVQNPPVQLGTSGGWAKDNANGFCCGGTLGSLVSINGVQHILSNYHVFESDTVLGGNNTTAQTGDSIIQPGLIDVNCTASSGQSVASLVKKSSLPNHNVDCSVAQVKAGMVRTDGSILEIGTLSSSTVAASINQNVKKSGRTTGLTHSHVSGLNGTISVTYDNECAGGTAFTKTFTGQIIVANSGSSFLDSGDSGSLMVEDVGTNPRAVGLLFAGSSTDAIANPINDVLTFLGATMVGGGSSSSQVNLTPFQPSGWSDKIVVSTVTGTNTDSGSLQPSNTLYVDWAVINNGMTATAASFSTQLYVDGVLRNTWNSPPPLNANNYVYVTDYSIGTLAAGTHTIKITTDSGSTIAESNETDNSITKTITVGSTGSQPNLVPYQPSGWSDKIVVSTVTGTNADSGTLRPTDTLYVDWAELNNGTAATSVAFSSQLFVDGVLRNTWNTPPPLNANNYAFVSDYSIGMLAAGTHTVRIVLDSGGAIAESNENDNSYTKTITVGATTSQANLTPYQPSGWSDKIVVSNVTGTNTDSSALRPSDTLYVDWAELNNGTAATGASFSSQLYVDGVLRNTWNTPPPLNANNYAFVTDYSIGTLSVGTHTIRIALDSGNTISESNESDNGYTKTITVNSSTNPNLTPYQPSGWSDKIVVSTGTGTTTDSASLRPTDTLYVDWAELNNGTVATAASFSSQLYVDGVLRNTWNTPPPLNANNYAFVTDYSIGTLGAGTHTVRIVLDSGNTVPETNENDNSYTKTITVGSTTNQPNLTPYQPSGWSDKIVVSTGAGTNTDTSSLHSTDRLYVDWAELNNGSGATASSFNTQLYVDGALRTTWSTPPPLNTNTYAYITDYQLGGLAAGTHTLRITVDSSNAISESNESDNSYTKTISVAP